MTSQTFSQQRAIAMHAAQRRKVLAARHKARIDALRERITRRVVLDAGGWAFAVLACGIAGGVVLGRVMT